MHLVASETPSPEIDLSLPRVYDSQRPQRPSLPYTLQADPGPSGLSELSQAAYYFQDADTMNTNENTFNHSSLLNLLFAILQSVLLESLPLAFNPSLGTDSYTNHLETVLGVMRIFSELVQGLEGTETGKHWYQVKSMIEKTLVYFPFSEQNVHDQVGFYLLLYVQSTERVILCRLL